MEDKYPIKEIKVMEGVYIWKPEKNINNDGNKNTNTNSNQNADINNNYFVNKSSIGENEYLCHGKDELIKIYEIEFEELGNRVLSLFQSNEDMMEFDPNDYDLIQAREENLELIDKKLGEIVKIQSKMKEICSYHPIVNLDIFEYFGIGKKPLSNKEENKDNLEIKKENLIEIEQKDDINKNDNNNILNNENHNKEENSDKKNKNENYNDIITEIEL